MQLEAWSRSDIGLVRKSNQDTIGVYADLSLFIVADGMGGHAHGDIASRMAVQIISDCLRSSVPGAGGAPPFGVRPAGMLRRFLGLGSDTRPEGSDLDRLKSAVELANQRIFEEGRNQVENAQQRSMATTVVALKFAADTALAAWAHVGDSRLYRIRDRQLALLTADHTLFGEAYQNTTVIPTDLPHSNTLVQALGIRDTVTVAMASDSAKAGDVFLLCSDGVSGLVDPAAILDQLTAGQKLADAGEALIRLALEAGGKDNASAVLVRVTD